MEINQFLSVFNKNQLIMTPFPPTKIQLSVLLSNRLFIVGEYSNSSSKVMSIDI